MPPPPPPLPTKNPQHLNNRRRFFSGFGIIATHLYIYIGSTALCIIYSIIYHPHIIYLVYIYREYCILYSIIYHPHIILYIYREYCIIYSIIYHPPIIYYIYIGSIVLRIIYTSVYHPPIIYYIYIGVLYSVSSTIIHLLYII